MCPTEPGAGERGTAMGKRAFVMLALCALIVGAWATGASAADIYVPADYGTIQAAVDAAASSGDVIYVAAGTYQEQVKIDGKSLDLVGAGIGSTIVEAVDTGSRTIYNITQWTGSARPIDACIGVVGPGTVNISGLTVDGRELGPDHFYGIFFFDTSGSVTDCRIEDILYAASPGASRVASLVATHGVDVVAYTIDFSGNVIPNFQKGGILLMGPYLTFTVDDNEITNVPSTIIAGNGIQLSYGATGTTSGNIVHGVGYAGDDWSATGILLFESGDISMDGDEVYDCESAVNFSDWGWIYNHPSQVALDFVGLDLHILLHGLAHRNHPVHRWPRDTEPAGILEIRLKERRHLGIHPRQLRLVEADNKRHQREAQPPRPLTLCTLRRDQSVPDHPPERATRLAGIHAHERRDLLSRRRVHRHHPAKQRLLRREQLLQEAQLRPALGSRKAVRYSIQLLSQRAVDIVRHMIPPLSSDLLQRPHVGTRER